MAIKNMPNFENSIKYVHKICLGRGSSSINSILHIIQSIMKVLPHMDQIKILNHHRRRHHQLHEICFSIPIYPEPNSQISCTLQIYFYYLHPHPLRPTPSPWRVINLHSQAFPYQHRCRPTMDMPKPSQTSLSNPIPY